MQEWLTSVWEQFRWTVMLITHDIREAIFLSDRVYVLTARPATVRDAYEVKLATTTQSRRGDRPGVRAARGDVAPGVARGVQPITTIRWTSGPA